MAELTDEKLTAPIVEEVQEVQEEENTEISNDDCESIHSESIHSESDDNDVMSDLEDDDDVEINKQTCALFLQQLWDAQRVNIKKKNKSNFYH
jgi:hypothetical protein